MMISANYKYIFKDPRLGSRGLELNNGLFINSIHSIQQLATSRAQQVAFYRFLKNDKVTEDALIKELSGRCNKLCKDKIVLAIQDTTEINLCSHKNRIDKTSGIGDLADGKNGLGFMIHPSLVVDANTCFPLGFSHIKIWNRDIDMADKHERDYKSLPIEEKESNKWPETSKETKDSLKDAKAIIIVQDREGDIYEQFAQVPDEKTFLLIRSKNDRRIQSNESLWSSLSHAGLKGHYQVDVEADQRRKTPARAAIVEVRYVTETILRPKNHINKGLPRSIKINAIEAKEINTAVENPIHWRIVTTWPVEDFTECICVLQWYTWRWQIEELFRTLKKEGYDIEASELENPWAIRKLAIIIMDVIIKLMQMRFAYNQPEGEPSPPVETVFREEEQQCLKEITKKYEGKTQKLKNPYAANTLKWAVWTIARLGGWKGYKSQRPPGMTTLQIGLGKFYDIFDGWGLIKDVCTR
jgi:hypothetical protein